MKKLIVLFILAVVFIVLGCSEKQELTVENILKTLDNQGINYEEQEQIHPSNELRKTIDNYVYELDEGRLRVHFFSTVEDRIDVQKDPYPAASFVATSAYGKDRVLLYYVSGSEHLAGKLDIAFEEWKCLIGCN